MQTTLRIDESLYREAEATREEVKRMAKEEQEAPDLAKLGLFGSARRSRYFSLMRTD